MTASRILFIVLDGISDRPCPALGGITPLAAAKTPVLDKLAQEGCCGIMDTIAPGIRPGSDTAHLALLGYDPYTYYTGRGPLECEGSGIHMEPGMIGFRCNYATISKEGLVIDRRAGRIHDTAALSAAIQDGVDLSAFGVEFIFRSGAGHRAALALKGEGIGHCVTSNDPKKEGVKPLTVNAIKKTPAHEKTAAVCNEFVRQSTKILFEHAVNRDRLAKNLNPANVVLMRGAGEMGNFEPFSAKIWPVRQRHLRSQPHQWHRQRFKTQSCCRARHHRLAEQQYHRQDRGCKKRTGNKGFRAGQYQGRR